MDPNNSVIKRLWCISMLSAEYFKRYGLMTMELSAVLSTALVFFIQIFYYYIFPGSTLYICYL